MKENNKEKHSAAKYLKYAGMAFQLLILLAIAVVVGKYLDKLVGTAKPLFTILTVLFFFAGYMIKLYKDLMD